ncbi:ClpP/crotonase-like domain-containing protein [Schizothecium vesticola]|uniref:ClpP/crotonase-like domain-containing protein n=1 Tax=Schizothecium vesticola TaxID=314040 RepID=A0AA40BQJ1_9PEZI|nr:ClpP/crotonase-like domain-containing protein [Schizothecium vesticola]
MASPPSVITTSYRGRVAVITINNPQKLNALNQQQYYALSQALREVATHDEVFITLLIGKGRYFSARHHPHPPADPSADNDTRQLTLRSFVAYNLNITQAFYTHPKILVAALNGPAVGLSAALVAHADFIYARPSTFLLTPFSSLGLVAEGGASRALVQRLGVGLANEALIMSRRIGVEELVRAGFVTKVFGEGTDDEGFKRAVMGEIEERLGEHLVGESLLGIKELIRRPEREAMEAVGVREVFAGLERFVSGVPQGEFKKVREGTKRHKL